MMALADYKLCDMCGCKAFYDVGLNYDQGATEISIPYKTAGMPQSNSEEMNNKYGTTLERVGDWVVLCRDCAMTHRTKIVPIEPKED